jgi:uncharacterized repeat protein (TIGR01451 family)
MKKKITKIGAIVIVTCLVLLGFSKFGESVIGFGQIDKESIYRSNLIGGNYQDTGVTGISECTDVVYNVTIWNDPIPGEYITNLKSVINLPLKFSNTKSFSSKAENFGLAQSGETLSENDIDALTWIDSAIGKTQKYKTGSAVMYYKNLSASLPGTSVQVTPNGDTQTVEFKNLNSTNIFNGNLYRNESIQIVWVMRVGDNCIDASKELVSNANTIYKSGDKVEYKFTIKNRGNYDYKDVKFTDTFDTNAYSTSLSDISFTKLTGDLSVSNVGYSNSLLSIGLGGDLNSGQTATFKLLLTVKNGFTSQTACNINATYTANDFSGLFSPAGELSKTNSLCVNLNQPTPGLGINKELVGSDLNQINYKITVSNTGNVTLNSLAVTDLYDESKLTFVSSVPSSNSAGNGVVSITNMGNLEIGAKKEVLLSFKFAKNSMGGQACNKEVNAFATYYKNERTLDITSKFEPDICVDTPKSEIEVVKYLSVSSSKQIEYTVEIKNKGVLPLRALGLIDIFDNTRLSVNSVEVADETVNGNTISIINLLGDTPLLGGAKVTLKIKFDVLAKAPAGLACNKEVSVKAMDSLDRVVTSKQVLTENTVNCVNLIVINEKEPNFSVSKRLVSKTDALVNDTVQWEIVTSNICVGNDCKVAETVAFKDYFMPDYMKFNSAFAQLKNADGTNVNVSPIAFTPVISSENGNTVLSYYDLTDIVGNVSAGQYIVVTIYTTALKTNTSCINNTVTISGPSNSVSAQACVNIVKPVVLSVNTYNPKENLPKTDILDSLSILMGAPVSLKIAFLILVLAIGFGTTVPTVLLVKAKKNN